MSDWDAAKYHRISDPQLAWGRAVLARLAPAPGERILDVGCGTGRLTEEIARTPGSFVVGLDRSSAMLREARARQPRNGSGAEDALAYVRGDGAALPFVNAFDAVFSTATLHWIPSHDRVFASAFRALKYGGRLVAQAGGFGNLDRLYSTARRLMRSAEYADFYGGWCEPFHFENVPDTEARLARAGFVDLETSLVASPVAFEQAEAYSEFVAAVCLRHHLERLPDEATRAGFMGRITEAAATTDPPLTLDYWRLNIRARKAAA